MQENRNEENKWLFLKLLIFFIFYEIYIDIHSFFIYSKIYEKYLQRHIIISNEILFYINL
jgi:hypothetical protein